MRPPVRRPGRLDGRTCLIVGGTGGIGLASARRFLEEGARVVLAGHSPEIGRSAMAQLAPLGPVWESTFELTSGAPEVARLFTFALDALGGRLDVMLHVAGISGGALAMRLLHEATDAAGTADGDQCAFLNNRAAVRFMLRQPVDPFAEGQCGECRVRAGLGARPRTSSARSPTRPGKGGHPLADPRRGVGVRPGSICLTCWSLADRHADGRPGRERPAHGQFDIAPGSDRRRSGTAEDVAEVMLYLREPFSRFVTGAELGGRRRLVRLRGCILRWAHGLPCSPCRRSTTGMDAHAAGTDSQGR